MITQTWEIDAIEAWAAAHAYDRVLALVAYARSAAAVVDAAKAWQRAAALAAADRRAERSTKLSPAREDLHDAELALTAALVAHAKVAR